MKYQRVSKGEQRFIVARSNWHASQLLKRIYKGRVENFENVLFKDKRAALHRINQFRLGVREEFTVFSTMFHKEQNRKS